MNLEKIQSFSDCQVPTNILAKEISGQLKFKAELYHLMLENPMFSDIKYFIKQLGTSNTSRRCMKMKLIKWQVLH